MLISTDKAVSPVSVMGASKWMAEQIVRSLRTADTVLCAVRFGNVLGSRGSVIPTFLRQIAARRTGHGHRPAMTRYFMSVAGGGAARAAGGRAVAAAARCSRSRWASRCNILDLAERMIRLSGKVPDATSRSEIVGPRPGEKLAEELVTPTRSCAHGPPRHRGIAAAAPGSGGPAPALPDWSRSPAKAPRGARRLHEGVEPASDHRRTADGLGGGMSPRAIAVPASRGDDGRRHRGRRSPGTPRSSRSAVGTTAEEGERLGTEPKPSRSTIVSREPSRGQTSARSGVQVVVDR